MTNNTITATTAKNEFAALIDAARRTPITITRNNRPVAVVLSPEEYAHLEALDDAYWGRRAEKSKKEGSLGARESEKFLKQMLAHAKN